MLHGLHCLTERIEGARKTHRGVASGVNYTPEQVGRRTEKTKTQRSSTKQQNRLGSTPPVCSFSRSRAGEEKKQPLLIRTQERVMLVV